MHTNACREAEVQQEERPRLRQLSDADLMVCSADASQVDLGHHGATRMSGRRDAGRLPVRAFAFLTFGQSMYVVRQWSRLRSQRDNACR